MAVADDYSVAEDELAKGFAGQYASAQETADAIAERMGRNGRANLHRKGENSWARPILTAYAERRISEGADRVVAGHFHMPFIHTWPGLPGKELVSLGAWACGLHYGELEGNRITLKQYDGASETDSPMAQQKAPDARLAKTGG